jgi:hypothetical protein
MTADLTSAAARRPASAELDRAAAALLEANTRRIEHEGRSYCFSVPSLRHYPFQWLWDSCFHAIVWARTDVVRAKQELEGLLDAQRPDGMIPHVLFWDQSKLTRRSFFPYIESALSLGDLVRGVKPHQTAQSQPPVLAQAVEAIAASDPAPLAYVSRVLPHLVALHRFWADERDPDGDGLISTISQFETGLDYSPCYDEVIGYRGGGPVSLFARSRVVEWRNQRSGYVTARLMAGSDQVEDVLLNAVYADGLHALARLADLAGQPLVARWASAQAARTTAALVERCWDAEAGLFRNLAGPQERRCDRVKTIQGLLPLMLPGLPAEVVARLLETLTDPRQFWPAFPVPAVALDALEFLPDSHIRGIRFIWRGPLSANTNWFLHRGLELWGERRYAGELGAKTRELAETYGFNEFYNPRTGAPTGEGDFGWATLATCV